MDEGTTFKQSFILIKKKKHFFSINFPLKIAPTGLLITLLW